MKRSSVLLMSLVYLSLACSASDRAGAQPPRSITARVASLSDSGRLDDAEKTARAAGAPGLGVLGDILVLRGRLTAADSAYRASIAANAPGQRTAQVGLAELTWRRGDRALALQMARTLTNAYENGANWNGDDCVATGRAYVLLGSGDTQSVKNALAAFDRAVAVEPSNIEGRLRVGDLFLDKYRAPDAKQSYEDVLKLVPGNSRALFGLARIADFANTKDVGKLLLESLKANPTLTPALLMQARGHLESEAYDSADFFSRRALAIDASNMTGWAMLGASAWITGDSAEFKKALAAAQKLNPKPSEFYAELADAAVRQRRYADGVSLANTALSMDSMSTRALGLVGTNQLREAKMEEGRATLERAFAIDPFNLWHFNTLNLLDLMRTYKTVDKGNFRLVAPPNEADILSVYLLPLLQEAYDTLSLRYKYKPPTTVRLEIFRQHSDFSVRTVGLVGLGALGVSFGPVLAMDAPSAREKGAFNWGATAWHELAHTFTLGSSANRVPRWLSEGLSVAEERRARASWGFDETLDFFDAYANGKLRPVSQLNEGFLRPRFDQETILSYNLASLVCEMIETQFGPTAIPAVLKAYKDGLETPEVFLKVLKLTPDSLDKRFDSYMKKRYATQFAALAPAGSAPDALGPFATAMRNAAKVAEGGNIDSTYAALVAAQAIWPDYAGPNGPAMQLAALEKKRGNLKGAVDQLARITSRNNTAWEPNAMEADLREQLGDTTGMKRALERLIWIYPYDATVHTRLAVASTRTKDFKRAILERRAIVALDPPDKLEAQYDLARALIDGGELAEARRTLLSVLEQSPAFEKAQTLLLELRNRGPGGAR
ncbi:MAG: tetratricopeptide repeat protein [Gemmatimonas sp.]